MHRLEIYRFIQDVRKHPRMWLPDLEYNTWVAFICGIFVSSPWKSINKKFNDFVVEKRNVAPNLVWWAVLDKDSALLLDHLEWFLIDALED